MLCGFAFAQPDSMIEQKLAGYQGRSVWNLGPVGLIPRLGVLAGYDSNSFSSSTDPQPSANVITSGGIIAFIPIKKRAILEFDETLNYRYYTEAESLDDFINYTSIRAAVGGKSWILSVEDSFRSGKTRVSSEVESPTDQRDNNFTASLGVSLGKQSLLFGYGVTSLVIQRGSLRDDFISERLSNVGENVYAQFNRYVTEKTSLIVRVFHQTRDFTTEIIPRDDKGTGIEFGVNFSNIGRVQGQALLGYEDYQAGSNGQLLQKFDGLIGSGDVSFRINEQVTIGGLYFRTTEPSISLDNQFFIEQRYGPTLTVLVSRPLTVRAAFTFGKNDYQLPVLVRNDEGELVEVFLTDTIDHRPPALLGCVSGAVL